MIDLASAYEVRDALDNKVIDSIIDEFGNIWYEAFKKLIASGVPPITLQKCKGVNLVDYKIYGNSVQDGTPTPDNPVDIQSVGERTKNLFDKNLSQIGYYGSYITKNGYTLNGVLWSDLPKYTGQTASAYVTNPIPIKPNTVYSYSGFNNNSNPGYIFLEEDKKTIINGDRIKGSDTFTTPGNARYIVMSILLAFIDTMMLQEGEITDYEPYGKYKIPVKVSGKNLFDNDDWFERLYAHNPNEIEKTNYKGDNCYLITMSSYYNFEWLPKNIKENTQYTLTADFFPGTGRVTFRFYYTDGTRSDMRYVNPTAMNWQKLSLTSQKGKTIASIRGSGAASGNIYVKDIQLEEGTSSTNYEPYVSPTTTNIYLNEPLRKIGDYADYIDFENGKVVRNVDVVDNTGTLTIEESYQGLATPTEETIELPTISTHKGTNIIEVDTSVLPSDMQVKYMGKE